MLGTLLHGRYKIIQVLATGGFGQTFVAEDAQQPDHPTCVVKQLKPASQDAKFLQIARRLFQTESDILEKLGNHPQIPGIMAHFEEDGEFYLVQELIEGRTLSDELSASRLLSETQVVSLLRDVLEVLMFIHSNQVIHRDIKPSNLIRRQSDGKLVLIDFGAVKQIQTQIATEADQTGHTVGIGTQGYVPSEQLMGKPRFSSDLYALGMTAIQALTGLHPSQLPTHPDTGEVIWQDQVRVSPWLTAVISRMVRYHFSQRYQSAMEVLQALDRQSDPLNDPTTISPTEMLDDLETRLLNTKARPITWKKLTKAGLKVVAIASLSVTGCILGVRQILPLEPMRFAVFEPLEAVAFDRMMQLLPERGVDPRLLIVEITEQDIRAQNRFPLPDRVIAQALEQLNRYQPRVVGLDLLRDIPQETGRAELIAQLKKPNVISIMSIGDTATGGIPAPPGIDNEQVGFNDFVTDQDNVIRRSLLFADVDNATLYSFSLRLALAYLRAEGIEPKASRNSANVLRLGESDFLPIEQNAGGYQTIDAGGYQILLNYRARNIARRVNLTQLLNGEVNPEWIRNKIILVGTTAPSAKDLFLTPYSSAARGDAKMPGVMLHAQMVSQILGAALENQPLLWYWAEPIEMLWISLWSVLAGLLAWCIRRPILLSLAEFSLLAALVATSFGILVQHGWVPVAAPAIAALLTTGIVVSYRTINPDFSDLLWDV